jgi:ribosomal protein S18 acetylase RimI-like enzyme
MGAWHMIRSGAIIPAIKVSKKFSKKTRETLKVMQKEQKENFEINPHIYLAVLGVSQKHQRKGFGGKMLKALIELADTLGLPIYFETQTEGNVVFYKKFGFEVMKEISLPNFNFPMWYMVRKNL